MNAILWTLLWIGRTAVAIGALTTEVRAQEPIDPIGLQRTDFTVAGASYQIVLPQGATLRSRNGPIDSVEIWDQHTTRRIRMFRMSPATDEADEKYDLILKLRSGGTLRYNLDRDIGGGMGGTEGELKGRLEIGTRVIAVACHDQSKGFVQPEWCVAYLHHLQTR